MKQILLIIICAMAACHPNNTSVTTTTDAATDHTVQLSAAQLQHAGLTIGNMKKKVIATGIQVSGEIDVPPQNMVSVSFPLGGFLKSTPLLPGVHIVKGEVIGVMEAPEFIQLQQDYLSSRVQLVLLEKEYARQQDLNKNKASTDKQLEETTAAYQSQRILNKALAEKLRLININADKLDEAHISRTVNIYAPINGYVSKVNVNIGRYLNPSDVLFEIVNPDDIHLALTIFEKDVNRLATGQPVIASTNSNPEKKYRCKIILIGKDISDDRSVQVHCHFEQYDKNLIPGTFMNATVETGSDTVWALPEEAVVRYGAQEYIFSALDKNTFAMEAVKTGNRENGYVELSVRPEQAGRQYVTKGAYALLMKMKNTAEEE